ncbi:PH domain-containing protein [Rossellomorea aquimaris]|uniref:PH domain-containing protein n=1 Tax=Rossellomorea aquimaris TaxID=189382 RepID=A0A5D4TTV9_9BACI|nr:PH domain-containing protein [Rossellomorea aquimaris]TYS74046.1 PH domain-containing protein [Rossellomorea aquimaris]TYS78625.1 PH domain-containing protein [Rossellomorea aquimaris]
MIGEPQKRISPKALKVWKIYGVIETLIVAAVAAGAITLTVMFEWPQWIIAAAVAVLILFTYLFVFFIPTIKWKRWRYEVREQEIELQRGIFIVKRTLVPMVRVQHVDTVQGPILKKYELATITISTAATVHEIPALDVEEADELRNSISQLARVAEDDV